MSYDSLARSLSAHDPAAVSWDDLDHDAVFEALGHPFRRRLLAYLTARDGPVAVDELLEHVARTVEPYRREPDASDRAAAAFYHWHGPKLADMALLEYDAERHETTATAAAAAVTAYLELPE